MSLGQIPTTVQNRCSDVQSYSKCLLSFGVVLRLLVTEVKVVLLNISLFLSGLQDQSLFKKEKKRKLFTVKNVLQLVLFGKKNKLPKSLWLTLHALLSVDSPEIQLPELEILVQRL